LSKKSLLEAGIASTGFYFALALTTPSTLRQRFKAQGLALLA
jgi:hypothetical protein